MPENCGMHPQMERLYHAARKLKGIHGQAELARAFNTSSQAIHNWELRGISKQGLLLAQRSIGCSVSWLDTGSGSMVHGETTPRPRSAADARRVPLVSYLDAGAWTERRTHFMDNDVGDFLVADVDVSAGAFAVEIDDDSMLAEFRPGDRVIVDPNVPPQPGDFVVAAEVGAAAIFKKYRPRGINDKGEMVFELSPLNEDYPSIRSDLAPTHIVGTMVEHRKYRRRG